SKAAALDADASADHWRHRRGCAARGGDRRFRARDRCSPTHRQGARQARDQAERRDHASIRRPRARTAPLERASTETSARRRDAPLGRRRTPSAHAIAPPVSRASASRAGASRGRGAAHKAGLWYQESRAEPELDRRAARLRERRKSPRVGAGRRCASLVRQPLDVAADLGLQSAEPQGPPILADATRVLDFAREIYRALWRAERDRAPARSAVATIDRRAITRGMMEPSEASSPSTIISPRCALATTT